MERLLTAYEVAQILRVHSSTVILWAKKKLLPALRVRKTIRFRQEDVEDFIISKYTGEKSDFFGTILCEREMRRNDDAFSSKPPTALSTSRGNEVKKVANFFASGKDVAEN